MKKISALQLFALMICARTFSLMTYFPYTDDNALVLMIAVFISTAIQALMILPILCFKKYFPSDNPCTLAMSANRPTGIFITLIYLLFFLWVTFLTIGNLSYFLDYYFADFIPRLLAVLAIAPAAAYIGRMNISVIGKTACASALFIFLLTIITVSGSLSDVSFINFHFADSKLPQSLLEAVKAETSRNRALVLLVFLLPDIKESNERKNSTAKAAYWYIVVKLILVETILALITIVLGDFAMISKLPFFTLSGMSKSKIIERYDAVFMAVWTMAALVKLGACVHCSGRCLKNIFTKIPFVTAVIISTALPSAVALFILIRHKWERIAYMQSGWQAVILTLFIIPTLMLIIYRKRRKGAVSQ